MQHATLGMTGLKVSRLALGTVALGRTAQLKYRQPASRPDARQAQALLDCARDLGINLLDTAPAYGDAEQRLGELLRTQPQGWHICTKVGEAFDGQQSSFDFSPEATRQSVERSLRRLGRECLDIVLIHSDGQDHHILKHMGTLQALKELRQAGKLRAAGLSHKTPAGAELALDEGVDVLMATLHPDYLEEQAVIARAGDAGVGVLIKKAMRSGHGSPADLAFAAAQPGVTSVVVGTTNAAHLRVNAAALAGAD